MYLFNLGVQYVFFIFEYNLHDINQKKNYLKTIIKWKF
jgi:hypothetical protein